MINILFSKKSWLLLSIVSLLLMGSVYIYQVNDLAQNIYLRDQNKQKLVELQKEIKRSKVAASQNHSLTQVDNLIKKKGYEKVGRIDYIQVSQTQVAASQ